MQIHQTTIQLSAKSRGFHLITDEILQHLPELKSFEQGIALLFLKHTSASLSINENCDPDVRSDMLAFFNHLVPENTTFFEHTLEGPDDMPAHIKSVLLNNQLLLPIKNGKFDLGTWQGIYLGEHRNQGGNRIMTVTMMGV